MPTRHCLGCGRLTSGRSYCAVCARRNEAEKQRRAPWTRLYKLPEWQAAKWAVHERDGYRCLFVDGRGRCTATSRTTRLEAHHIRKIKDLWLDAGRDWQQFLFLALDRANIVTLCYRHHLRVDQAGQPGRQPKSRLSARPLPRLRRVK